MSIYKMEDNFDDWADISDEDLEFYESLVEEYGAFLSEEQILELEEHEDITLPECVKDFFREPTGRPITGLDFSSLYPSLIMCYNISPEYIIEDVEVARQAYKEDGHDLHKIQFKFGPNQVTGWCIRHDNKIDPEDKEYKFGVFPHILRELYQQRKKMKKDKIKYEHELEQMRKVGNYDKALYDEIQFKFDYVDAKQKALKVYMNCFYGEVGSKISPLFIVHVAGGITSAGQKQIKAARDIVIEKGCQVFYGDTDSIYLSVPEKAFKDIDTKFYSGQIPKKEYWEKQVTITFDEIKVTNKIVNDYFIEDTGNAFLKMAYEEALYPSNFSAKKKYYGVPHISVPNFDSNELFIRGFEVKKRGVSGFLRKVFTEIMNESMSIHDKRTMMSIIHDKIDDVYAKDMSDWDFKDFIMSAVWKPKKQNVKVHMFVERMEKERGIEFEPGERFNYVIVHKYPYKYSRSGRKVLLKIGEQMEPAEAAQKEGLELNLDYYMDKGVNGQLARLLTYAFEEGLDDEVKILDKARKHVVQYSKKYVKNYTSKGPVYQKLFRKARTLVKDNFHSIINTKEISKLFGYTDLEFSELPTYLRDKAEKEMIAKNKKYGKEFVDNKIDSWPKSKKRRELVKMQDEYYAGKEETRQEEEQDKLDGLLSPVMTQINQNMVKIKKLFTLQSGLVDYVLDYLKEETDIDSKCNEPDAELPEFEINDEALTKKISTKIALVRKEENLDELLKEFKTLYMKLCNTFEDWAKVTCIIDALKDINNSRVMYNPGKERLKKMRFTEDSDMPYIYVPK